MAVRLLATNDKGENTAGTQYYHRQKYSSHEVHNRTVKDNRKSTVYNK